mmetsp:Transcript_28681/g.98999  ORF Transcript_28681/g.98999 Transcript_28681/m.98999 type:complete len:98 (+) Transcript_28681:2-295(+)
MLAEQGRGGEALREYGRCVAACGAMLERAVSSESVGMARAALEVAVEGMRRNEVGPQQGTRREVRGAVQQAYARAAAERRTRRRTAAVLEGHDDVEL